MSNLISVTQRGPDILDPVRDAVGSSYGQKIVGDVRKAGAVLKSNPMGLLISELIFPPAVADGTLKGKPIYEDKSYDIMDEIPRNIGSPKVFPKPQDPNIRTMEFREQYTTTYADVFLRALHDRVINRPEIYHLARK